MKSLLKDEYLQQMGRMTGENYDIGILRDGEADKLNNKGFEVQGGELVCQFQGVVSCLNFIAEHEKFGNREPNKAYDESYETRSDSDWTAFDTYDKATKAMLETPEVFRNFTEADIKLSEWDSVGNAVDFELTGDYLDVGRHLEGSPECFGVMRDGRVQNRFCSIVIDGCASWFIQKNIIALRASRALRLVDMLEANGIRCEVAVLYSTGQVHAEIIVKHYNDPLDINDIAASLSPDFFRWVVFRLMEHSIVLGSGYGYPADYKATMLNDEDADNTIYISHPTGNGKERINKEFDRIEQKISEGFKKGEAYSIL